MLMSVREFREKLGAKLGEKLRDKKVFNWLLIATILSVQIGCGHQSDPSQSLKVLPKSTESQTAQKPVSNVLQMSVPLNSVSQVPRRNSVIKANASLTVNLKTRALSAQVEFGEHEVVAAHIHHGFAGEVGSVVAAFEFAPQEGTMTISEFQLTESQLAQLLVGGYYLNLHSHGFPEGFLRGQILPDSVSTRIFELSDAQLVPHRVSGSEGAGYITLNHDNSSLRVNAFINSENKAVGAHVHEGRFGENGSPIVTLKQNIENPNHWYSDELVVTAKSFDAIKSGMSYINIYTDAFPEGEVRGQIALENQQILSFSLSSLQSNSPRVSAQSGMGNLVLDSATGNINVFLSTQGVTDATHASIYAQQTATAKQKENSQKTGASDNDMKETGTEGKSVLRLNQKANNPQQFSLSSTLSKQQVQQILEQEWVATVSSAAFPDGAVSGRVLMKPSPTGLVLDPLSLVGASNTYSINLNGEPLGSAIIEMLLDNGLLSVIEKTDAPAFGIVETLSVQIDAYTLAPLGYSGTGKSGERSIDINYSWEHPKVSGSTDLQSEPFIKVLPGHSVEQLGLFYSLHALPLKEGLSYPITVFNALDNTLLERGLKVLGIKEITVGAGTYEVFEVLLDGADVNQIFYISTDTPRKLIKIGFDAYPITYELQA